MFPRFRHGVRTKILEKNGGESWADLGPVQKTLIAIPLGRELSALSERNVGLETQQRSQGMTRTLKTLCKDMHPAAMQRRLNT